MAPTSYTCRYCKKPNVARSLQGLKSHISQSARCRARRDEELANRNRSIQDGPPHAHQQPAEHHDCQEESFEDHVPHSGDGADDHRSKRARVDDDDDTENFRSTSTNYIVDYPEEARAGAILEDSLGGLET